MSVSAERVPTPLTGHSPDAAVVDVVTEVEGPRAAWRARVVGTSHTSGGVLDREGLSAPEELLIASTMWAVDVVAPDVPVLMRLHSYQMWSLARAALPERFRVADPLELNAGAAWARSARHVLFTQIAHPEAKKQPGHEQPPKRKRSKPKVLYGASDGSAHPRYGSAAAAWVSTDGQWKAELVRGDVLSAELVAAIGFAKHLARSGADRGVLFIDSQDAIAVLERRPVRHRITLVGKDLELARQLVADGALKLVWVKSHRGHVLNELADRLALQKSRGTRLGLPHPITNGMCKRIVAGAMPEVQGTNWGAQIPAAAAHMTA